MSGTVIARSPCGDYGDDTLIVSTRSDGAIEIERVAKNPSGAGRWTLGPTDRLRVTGSATGDGRMILMETQLAIVALDGNELVVSHFEFDLTSGGVTHEHVATLARTIADAAGCAVTVEPLVIPERGLTPPAEPGPAPRPEISTPHPGIPSLARPQAASPAPHPASTPTLVGTELATLAAGRDADEPIRAVRLLDGTVVLENAKTGARWSILREDTLVIAPYVNGSGSAQGVWSYLDRLRDAKEVRIADFAYWDDGARGVDETEVARFVATIAEAAACTVVHRALVWP